MSSHSIVPNLAFIEAARYTRPKSSQPKVYVYVEDDIDTQFWRTFLNEKEYGCVFVISVYKVCNKEERGKDAMMKDYKEGRLPLSNSILLCLDSDLDLIIDNYHSYTQEFRESPYIINTVWYAIENLKCNYDNVKKMLYKVTLAKKIDIDVKKKLSSVSCLLHKLFLVCLVSYKLKDQHYSLEDFGKAINSINFNENGDLTGDTTIIINSEIAGQNVYLNKHKREVSEMKKLLENKGYTTDDYLNLIQGHDLADKIIKPFVKAVGGNIRDLRKKEIGGSSANSQYKRQLQQQYDNQTGVTKTCCLGNRIDDLIRDCYDFDELSITDEIKSNIQKALVYGKIASIIGGLKKSK